MAENYNVRQLRAVATSAAREATNGDLLVDRVFRTSGIEIEIISGEEEARLIHLDISHMESVNDVTLKEAGSVWKMKVSVEKN
jgi:exopolyphosphatase / guanosine-5'-triphosphate,3'-diphosphate pyrophosphatase